MKMLSIFSFSDNKNSNKYSPNIKNKLKENSKIKIGLLTNEIPPIVYGGVATWIINFLDMFKDAAATATSGPQVCVFAFFRTTLI